MLINCPECGHEISHRARRCPGCGFPISEGLSSRLVELKKYMEKEEEVRHQDLRKRMLEEDKLKNGIFRFIEYICSLTAIVVAPAMLIIGLARADGFLALLGIPLFFIFLYFSKQAHNSRSDSSIQ